MISNDAERAAWAVEWPSRGPPDEPDTSALLGQVYA